MIFGIIKIIALLNFIKLGNKVKMTDYIRLSFFDIVCLNLIIVFGKLKGVIIKKLKIGFKVFFS